jgi:4-hydroxy-3-polyprenylbenzoate decarboxylase
MRKILISIGGASGSIYGIRLLEILKEINDVETHLIISEGAKKIIEHETNYSSDEVLNLSDFNYNDTDLFSGPASGSFQIDEMIICPCSMKTLSAVANGFANTLTARAAMCMLKENKPLILTIRETPLDLASLRNMVSVKEAGGIILPAMPGFYHKPEKIQDMTDFIIGKILDQLKIKHSLYNRWK